MDGYNPFAPDLRSTVEKEEAPAQEAKELRLPVINKNAAAALSACIMCFPEIDPDQLQEELCDALAGDGVLATAKRWAV